MRPRRLPAALLIAGVAGATIVLASPAGASSSIAANSTVVTATIKNAFFVQPSSPPVSAVSCPSKQVRAVNQFTCAATVDGQKVPVAVRVLDTVPLTVNATPQKAVLSVDRSEGSLEGAYYQKTGVAVSAECPIGTKQFVVVNPGASITCMLVGAHGPIGNATVTATDTIGGYASSTLPE